VSDYAHYFHAGNVAERAGDTVNVIGYIQAPSLMNRGLVGVRTKHHKNFISFVLFENIC
jgi:hypothetical protein